MDWSYRMSKTPPAYEVHQKFKYQCYLCDKINGIPIFKKHFRLCHPEETFDKTRVIKVLIKSQVSPVKEKVISLKDQLPTTGDVKCPQCVLTFPTENQMVSKILKPCLSL